MKNYKFLLGGLLAASLSIGFVSCGDDEDSTPSDVPNNNVSNNTNNSTNDGDKKEEQKPAINPKFDFSSAMNATDKTVDCGKELTFTVSNCNDAAVFVFVDGKLISGNNNVFKLPTDKEGKHEVTITVNSTDYTESYEVKAVAKPEFKFLPATEDETPSVEVGEDLVLNVTNCGDAAVIVFVDGKLISGEKNVFKMPTDKVGKHKVSITINGTDYTESFEVKVVVKPEFKLYPASKEEIPSTKVGTDLVLNVTNCGKINIFVDGKEIYGEDNVFKMPTDKVGVITFNYYLPDEECGGFDWYNVKASGPEFMFQDGYFYNPDKAITYYTWIGNVYCLYISDYDDAEVSVLVDGQYISPEDRDSWRYVMPTDRLGKYEVTVSINDIEYLLFYEVLPPPSGIGDPNVGRPVTNYHKS